MFQTNLFLPFDGIFEFVEILFELHLDAVEVISFVLGGLKTEL